MQCGAFACDGVVPHFTDLRYIVADTTSLDSVNHSRKMKSVYYNSHAYPSAESEERNQHDRETLPTHSLVS